MSVKRLVGVRAVVILASICLVVAGDPIVQGFHNEIHHTTQAALALASDWEIDDALWIAGADLAVDMNKPTVAGLERNTLQYSQHQAEKNYYFHCFSRSDDQAAARSDERNKDVLGQLDDLKRQAAQSIDRAKAQATDSRLRIEALVAVGVYFHCQQDSWSHSGYGGTRHGHMFDDAWPGSPDHPARRPVKTQKALRESLSELHALAGRWRSDLPPHDANLNRLLAGLTNTALLGAGTQECVDMWPRYWLYQDLRQSGRLAKFTSVDRPTRGTCATLHQTNFGVPGASARIVTFPGQSRFPVLDIAGRPRFENDEPILVAAGDFDYVNAEASATYRQPTPSTCSYAMSVLVRNGGPNAAPTAKIAMALLAGQNDEMWYEEEELGVLSPNQVANVGMAATVNRACPNRVAFVSDIQPIKDVGDGIWGDRDARNDQRVVLATPDRRAAAK
ncbi:MAG: hypothetical protein WC829_00315 [Hyphomicrobium sp.]|jgi:hypothetical protein